MAKLITISILMLTVFSAFSQIQKGSIIRGQVIDKISRNPLIGANVILLDSIIFKGTSTDNNGNFRIENIPVGRIKIKASYIGYKIIVIPVITHSVKEVVIIIEMEESVIATKEITIQATVEKDHTVNKMTNVSARLFTIEESNRYAGSMNDPSRMTKNFAGVMGSDETRNDIIIRGNSPSGLLWRLDDIDIPNPNHFASQGTSGGLMSILNNNTLSNSDFISGAFNAEYTNALSGVFDLKMKTGNNEKHEYTTEFSINGLEIGAEGPFSENQKTSYLIHFRYADFTLVDRLVDLGISGIPSLQDLSFKFNFPINKGNISVTGIAGTSNLAMKNRESDSTDFAFDGTPQNLYLGSDMAAAFITYTWFMNNNTYSKFTISGFYSRIRNKIDTINNEFIPFTTYKDYSADKRFSTKYIINKKINSRLSLRAGITVDKMMFALNSFFFNSVLNNYQTIISDRINFSGGPVLTSVYNQWLCKFTDKFKLNIGLNVIYFDLNNSKAIEPRAGCSWELSNLHKLSLGYGLHSRLQPVITYFSKTLYQDGTYLKTNKKLNFSKAHHLVLSYDYRLTENMRLKSELYYQYLFNIPVESHPSAFSMLNSDLLNTDYEILIQDSLKNDGIGKNYGIEITLEKFFHKGYYFLFTTSLYESKYKGSDDIERNTVFNGNYIFNFLIGREFKLTSQWTIIADFKVTYSGGKRYTPIDLQKSIIAEKTVAIESETNSKLFDPYYKGDIKIGFRYEGKRVSQEFAINADNFTNHKNGFRLIYNKFKKNIEIQSQLGILPGVYYRIYF